LSVAQVTTFGVPALAIVTAFELITVPELRVVEYVIVVDLPRIEPPVTDAL
jgi:hypothetical protein